MLAATFLWALPLLGPVVPARALAAFRPAHAESSRRASSSSWYHADDHPAHALFKRADGDVFAEVGSPAWLAAYPEMAAIDTTPIPQEWTNALAAAVAAGKIPDIPVSVSTGGNPVYPHGLDPLGQVVCSSTYKQCRSPGDIWDPPNNTWGTGFDDGPTISSPKLYNFLQANNETSTQFMIGIAIKQAPKEFQMAYNSIHLDIAAHTYTHRRLTTLTNAQILSELGWTNKIIYDSTGGKIPMYMRPPTGDSDNRVRAIAKEVFGLTMILWNHDTLDWSMSVGGTTPAVINASLTQWITGPRNPGLIVLEHELTDQTVQAFIDAYPLIKQNGWTMKSVSRLYDGDDVYRDGGVLVNGGNNTVSMTTSVGGATTTTPSTTGTTTATGTSAPAPAGNSNAAAPSPVASGTIPTMFIVSVLMLSIIISL